MSELGRSAGPKASLVSDMSTALISGFQILNLLHAQRLFPSQGLRKMGYDLPSAIASWFVNSGR